MGEPESYGVPLTTVMVSRPDTVATVGFQSHLVRDYLLETLHITEVVGGEIDGAPRQF